MNIAVIGLGKLGAPLAAVAATKGHSVVGVDTSLEVVQMINHATAPVFEPGLADLISALPTGRLTATTCLADAIQHAELSILIVPTPSLPDGAFDARLLVQLAADIAGVLTTTHHPHPHTVVISSTVMPGTTAGSIRGALESTGLVVGTTVGLVYSPEFIALGRVLHDLHQPDMVFIGADDVLSRTTYQRFIQTIVAPVMPIMMTTREAELAKLAVNCYITMKISFANMVGMMCHRYGADPHLVTHAVGQDSRIGRRYFKPGGPWAGPCFPRDGRAWQTAAAVVKLPMNLMTAVQEINDLVVETIMKQCAGALVIVILGLTYKVDTSVTDESLGRRLETIFATWPETRVLTHDPAVDGRTPAQELVDSADTVVIATEWPEYCALDYTGKYLVDPWGLLREYHVS